MLTIAVSSRSLFHIEDGDKVFIEQGQDAFNAYMRDKEATPLRRGVAFSLVQKLLALNKLSLSGRPLVDVVLLSRNSPDAGMRVMNSIQHYGLPIERAAFTQGGDRFKYARAMGADLFLSTTAPDVQRAIEQGLAAATLLPSEQGLDEPCSVVKIAFDGDSVLFSSEADDCYHAGGLAAFRASELANAQVPLGAGPFKGFLQKLHALQQELPTKDAPLRIALVTARGMPAHARVIHTLRSWDIRVDEGIFAAGCPKGPLLDAFGADMFFDDTHRNIESARSCNVMSGHVPFGLGGIVAPELELLEP